jgi:hypothetical protein
MNRLVNARAFSRVWACCASHPPPQRYGAAGSEAATKKLNG